eukprot:2945904-Prymnesium_polylepis.1
MCTLRVDVWQCVCGLLVQASRRALLHLRGLGAPRAGVGSARRAHTLTLHEAACAMHSPCAL